jgi:DNA repair ATPase RecN
MDTVNTDAKIRDLEHIVQEKEREIQMLRENIHNYNVSNPVSEERMVKLEREVKEIEGLVRGLTAEMLDLKAWVQKLAKAVEEDPAEKRAASSEKAEKGREYPVVESPKVAAERRSAEKARSAPVVQEVEEMPAEDEDEEVLIIQPDGTMKREAKFGEDMIVADHRAAARQPRVSGGREADRRPLIYADDDDAVEVKRRRN